MRFWLRFLAIVFAVAIASSPSTSRAANDPNLQWSTIETPHFRISYYSGEADLAQHVADLAEAIHGRLSPALGWAPREKVEIALTDQTDSANGLTSALPYNSIRLFVTAPDDLSPLGDVDDWYQELLTHEYTHTLHIDHIGGIPALVNRFVGKTMAPNQVQPRWLLEGLAVFEETARTSGGRLRSSQWNMYMRADVLEHNVAPLDVFSNTPRRWPQGNIWYLYGSFFLQWIAKTYGEETLRAMIADYGSQLIPFGVNRSIRRVVGKTFDELYPLWIASMRAEYGAQAAEVRARGVREGVRLTRRGAIAEHPAWIPENAWPGYAGGLLYFRDDNHTTGGLYGVKLARDAAGRIVPSDPKKSELLIRTNGVATASFEPDGGLVFSSTDVTNNLFAFNDLFEMPRGQKSTSGLEGNRARWTYGFRATDPSVSPDGRRVVFATNHRGTMYLQIADVGDDGVSNVRPLVMSGAYEQVFAPEWSPDGAHVAYSVWTKGGYRDIRYVDVRDGSYVEVTRDRAIDGGPAFSRDGRWLFFHSDRTKIMNVYAWEIATGRLMQVTNVLSGAYQPAPSPDGKTLAYIGYTHEGFDLFAMDLDESTWTEALPYVNDRPPAPPEPEHHVYPVTPYNPLYTLRPRKYGVSITPGNFGQAISTSVAGNDIAGLHAFGVTLTTEVEKPELQFDATYVYGGLPFDVTTRVFRSITPRGGYSLGENYKPIWVQETAGVETGLDYAMPTAFDGQQFSLTYTAARLAGDIPIPVSKLDPYETPTIPQRGFLGALHLGWGYSNAQRFLWSVGPEKGFSLSANIDFTNPALASDFTGFAAASDFSTYVAMPWAQHHSLGLHVGGGTSGGTFPGRGPFFVGGLVDLPVIDTVRNSLIQGGITLRGYPSVIESGRSYALFNAEYRFPILNVDRGASTLPFFIQRVSGNVFLDYGSAFNDASAAEFKTGSGAELWFDSLLGYVLGFTFRLGYAHGWASGGIDKVYFVAAVPF